MSEYKKLKEKFEQDVKELQENCPHNALSEPIEVYWAIGHSCGYSSRYCERCNKQMYRPPLPKVDKKLQEKFEPAIKELLEKRGDKREAER